MAEFTPSSRANPCPICSRTKDGDCRIGAELVLCHHGSSHHPPEGLRPGETHTGGDGQQWAYTKDTSDGRAATFTPHKPLQPASTEPPLTEPPLLRDRPSWRYSATFYVVRKDHAEGGKSFLPLTWVDGTWIWKAPKGKRPMLLSHPLAAKPDATVLIVEGEKTWDAARRLFPGLIACCWSGGCKAISKTDFTPLAGRKVVLWPDNDDAGRDAMERLAQVLYGVGAASVKVVANPNDEPQGWDIADADWTTSEATAWVKANTSEIAKTVNSDKPKPKGVEQGDLDGEIDGGPSPSELLGLSERLAEGRRMFSLKGMLPSELADALDVVQASLPTDPVSAVMSLLTGYSGLLKLNTRVASSYNFSKPVNLYSGAVLPSGLAKTPIKNNLLDDPAADIRRGQAKAHERAMTEWREQNKGKPKDERTAPPAPLFPHVTDYTPAALYNQLHAHEQRGLGVLILRDELSGLFGRVTADTNSGSGDGEAQLLELFDGDGYTGLRVTSGARHFDRCHVSLYGNIQPDVLKEIINGNDSTGKFARFLFFRVPSRPLVLQDADPTEEERRQFAKAQQTLQDYAQKLFALPARTYEFNQTARTRFHAWFREHQHRSLLPGTPKVIQALLGKTSAHALRLAGILHILKVVDGEVAAADRITADTVDVAMAIVDQLTAETEAFHEQPAECDGSSAIELMRHIHNLSWFSQKPVTRQNCRDKGGRVVRRELKAPVYSQLVDEMVRLGYGIADKATQVNGKNNLAYEATREMPE